MSKKRTRRPHTQESATNWKVIGGVIGFGAVALIALLVYTVTAPETAAEPTPVLEGNVNTLADYCETNADRCIFIGDEDAPNTLVEVSDYGCSHCREFNETTSLTLQETYLAEGQLNWWLFPYALSTTTSPSAAALLCVAEQADDETIMDFHEMMFELQDTTVAHQPEGFSSVATNVGLDVDAFDECVASEKYLDTVSLNRQAAAQVGISGTPSFFLNGVFLEGNQPLASFVQQIEIASSN